ncbi:hypothetical protein RI129_006233 [Pyrocoelia pectoralis]|uniref:Homeobox domain-containing protein n=1 Tax=Pyrocoelia pectoralis TaxID=417401 RepID=A0AAN7ZNG0_9COLE
MVSVLQKIPEFWNQDLWLPENVTWDDISVDSNPKISYVNYKHLFFAIPLSFLILGLWYFLQRKTPPPNRFLERSYSLHKKLTHEEILGLAKQLDWTERNVERWLRIRRNQDKTSTLDKFCETAWRVCYYLCFFIIGVIVLWNKRWLWDINEYKDVCLYLIIALSFYGSLCISPFSDVKRKDFWQITLQQLLQCYQKVCDAVFIIFIVMWMVTRLGIYPFWIIRSAIWYFPEIAPVNATHYFLNGLLIFIFVLDIFWTYFILKVVYMFCKIGRAGDTRSSSSENND